MKKLITIILILALAIPASSLADLPDLSGLSFDELIQLKSKLNIAIWNCQEWQEVTVPPGVWEVGKDIPEGHWSIRPEKNCGPSYAIYSSGIEKDGHDVMIMGADYIMECICDPGAEFYDPTYKQTTDFDMKTGYYIRLDCTMIFTPYTGKPDLGFK